jgi:hypothetical protein
MLDVLEYNLLADQFNSLQTSLNVATTYANTATYPSAYANAAGNAAATQVVVSLNCSPVKQNNYGFLVTCALQNCPWDCCTWASIPALTGNTGGLTIVDTASGYCRCGVSCLWTVPAGASFARFEIWGAGAASKGNACCGLTMPGGSGAYASVILPVVPGCQYQICAGCALCCCYYCDTSGLTAGQGCMSFVTGYGLSNFCADGGDPHPGNWLYNAARGGAGGTGGYCIIQNNSNCGKISTGVVYGYCMCQWGGFCFAGSCTSHDMFCQPTISGRRGYGNLTIPATRGCHFVTSAPGMFGASLAASTWDSYRYFINPPIVNLTCATCNNCYLATTMGGCSPSAFPFPSRGGIGGNVCAGNMSYGLPGGGGLVCIYWL